MSCEHVVRGDGVFPAAVLEKVVRTTLSPEPSAAGVGRRFVAEHAGDRVDEEAAETLALLTSELVTNGVLHARTPLDLELLQHEGEVLVCVSDANTERPTHQPFSAERPDGRGLVLVQAMAHRCGTTYFDGGKTVWFTVLTTPNQPRR